MQNKSNAESSEVIKYLTLSLSLWEGLTNQMHNNDCKSYKNKASIKLNIYDWLSFTEVHTNTIDVSNILDNLSKQR